MTYGKFLYDKLPSIYRQEDSRIGFPLQRFLEVLGGGLDEIEKYILDFSNIIDVDSCPASLLPFLAKTYGLEFPYDMDEKSQRKFIKVIPYLYQYKGTDKAYRFLAREIFGEGTVTNTYTLMPPEGVSWDDWINNPDTAEDWLKTFIRVEVDGETLNLEDRALNFIKFIELIRPANRRAIPNLVLFYKDLYNRLNLNEYYNWDWINEDNGIFEYRYRTGIDRINELYTSDICKLTEEDETYDRTNLLDYLEELLINQAILNSPYYKVAQKGLEDYIKCLPEDEVRTSIFFDTHVLDSLQEETNISYNNENLSEAYNLDTSKTYDDDESYLKEFFTDAPTDFILGEAILGWNHSSLSQTDLETYITCSPETETNSFAKDDTYVLDTNSYDYGDEVFSSVPQELTQSSSITQTRTSTKLSTLTFKLNTTFITTDYTPLELNLAY